MICSRCNKCSAHCNCSCEECELDESEGIDGGCGGDMIDIDPNMEIDDDNKDNDDIPHEDKKE